MANTYYVSESLTADGAATGVVTVGATALFKIGAICWLNGTSLPGLEVQVMQIQSSTTLLVQAVQFPPVTTGYGGSDVSLYTMAASSTITQPGGQYIDSHDEIITNMVQDPVTGLTVPQVQYTGGSLPATVTQGVPNTNANGWPVKITDGTNILGTDGHPLAVEQEGWQLDMTATNVSLIPTTTSDANVTLSAGWYRMVVAGVPAHINVGGTATTSHPLYPVGSEDAPTYRAAQTVHAITDAGTGQVFFIPAITKSTV